MSSRPASTSTTRWHSGNRQRGGSGNRASSSSLEARRQIHPDNGRPLKAFLRSGFLLERETPALKSFSMTLGRYLQLLREGDAGDSTRIYITEIDKARLERLIAIEQGPVVVEIEHELERAIIVKPRQVACNVVTMNAKALLQLDE